MSYRSFYYITFWLPTKTFILRSLVRSADSFVATHDNIYIQHAGTFFFPLGLNLMYIVHQCKTFILPTEKYFYPLHLKPFFRVLLV